MAKIYSAPKHIKRPDYLHCKGNEWQKEDERYIKQLKEFLKANGYTGKNVGEIVDFPMADSYASYMVISMKPLELFHLETGDAWDFPYTHLMTAKEIQQRIDLRQAQQKALAKYFKEHKNELP